MGTEKRGILAWRRTFSYFEHSWKTESYFSLLLSAAGGSLVPQAQQCDDERWDVTFGLSLFILTAWLLRTSPLKQPEWQNRCDKAPHVFYFPLPLNFRSFPLKAACTARPILLQCARRSVSHVCPGTIKARVVCEWGDRCFPPSGPFIRPSLPFQIMKSGSPQSATLPLTRTWRKERMSDGGAQLPSPSLFPSSFLARQPWQCSGFLVCFHWAAEGLGFDHLQ